MHKVWRTAISHACEQTHKQRSLFSSLVKSAPKKHRKSVARVTKHVLLFDDIGKQLNIQTPSDWYRFSKADLAKAAEEIQQKQTFLSLIRNAFNGSTSTALKTVYPSFDWDDLKFARLPGNAMKNEKIQKEIFERVEKQLRIQCRRDWQKYSSTDALNAAKELELENAFLSLLGKHRNSINNVIEHFYKLRHGDGHHDLGAEELLHQRLQHKAVKRGLLQDASVQKSLFTMLEKELKVQKPEDWYNYSRREAMDAAVRRGIQKPFRSLLVARFNNSLTQALKTLYPETEWDEIKFKQIRRLTLVDLQTQKKIFKDIEQKLGIQNPQEWYTVSLVQVQDAAKKAGVEKQLNSLVRHYYSSFKKAVVILFPEYQLDEYKFTTLASTPLDTLALHKSLVRQVEEVFNLRTHEDWYRISNAQINRITSKMSLIIRNNGIYNILKEVYPEYPWDRSRLVSKSKKSQQFYLKQLVQALLGEDVTVLENYQAENMTFTGTSICLELDIYVPQYKLAIEYNGIQHYQDVGIFGSFRDYNMRDQEKQEMCAKYGITLLVVPYTWDSSLEYIKDLMSKARPDILLKENAVAFADNFSTSRLG